MGFIQKLAKRNSRVYKQTSKSGPKYVVKNNTLYQKVKPKKKSILHYLNPKNW